LPLRGFCGLEGQDLPRQADADGHQEGQVQEADDQVERIEQQVGLFFHAEHHLDGGQVRGAAGIDAHGHARHCGGFFADPAAEQEESRHGRGDHGHQADQQRGEGRAEGPILEMAGKQDQRQRQRDRHARQRVLQGEQALRHPFEGIDQQIPGHQAEDIHHQDASDPPDQRTAAAQRNHACGRQKIE